MHVKRPDASHAWLGVSSVPLFRPGEAEAYGVTTTFADVTQERQDARLLEESLQQYRLLADNTADMVSRRTLDHRFQYASPSHTAILGWTPEELIGRTPFELIHPDDLARVRSGPVVKIAAGSPSSTTFRVRHKDGHYIWIEGLTTPLKDASGVHTGYAVCARDITARRQLEEQLRQSQKMEAMGRMASGVAHDFNNLLTVIRNAAELIQGRGASVTDDGGCFAELEVAVSRAASLTSRLLAFSSGQHSEPQPLAIAAVVRESRSLLQRVLSETSRLELQIAPAAERAWVWADKTELTQVLLNLVMNAVDAMPNGGPVEITVEPSTLDRPLAHRLGAVPRGEYIKLAITDSGVGIHDAQLEHIFEPFYTTKPQGKGTGLGLSTVWGIVQHAHGAVVVDSVPNRGSRFTVYWPLSTASGSADAPTVGDAARPSRSGGAPSATEPRKLQPGAAKTLLLVDDEPAVLSLVSQLLERCGYRVLRAGSGEQALQLLTQQRDAVNALVTDVRMPGMSGLELVAELRALGIDLPVLFVSGQLDAQIPSGPRGSQRRFLPKPFTAVQLERELDQLFATSESPRELMN
jgi:PAS domain S-box-containing protein